MRSSTDCKALLILGLAFSLTACVEQQEGCLDINAVNFQVDADRPCTGCCEYPVLELNFQHKAFPDTSLNLVYEDSVYQDGSGNSFRFRQIRYYLSALHLVRPDGAELTVEDTLQLPIEQPDGHIDFEIVEDNFVLVNPGDYQRKEIGTIHTEGTFSKVKFTFGLAGAANTVDPGALPGDHPLSDPSLYWNADSGRIFNRIELFRVENDVDTIETVLEIGMPENLRTIELPLPDPFFLDPGFSAELVLRVDYLTWFEEVNLISDSKEQIIEKIVNKLTESFSVVEIEAKSG
jgi:hypothetical protein